MRLGFRRRGRPALKRARPLGAALVVMLYLTACSTQWGSAHTPIGSDACWAPETDIVRVYAARDLGIEECKAPPPYRLFVVSSDARSWIDLSRNNRIWSTEQRVVYGRDLLALGHFPNVEGGGVAEWRLDEKGGAVALIVPLKLSTDQGHPVSTRLVIGIAAGAVCDLGLVQDDAEARRIADRARIDCVATLPESSR